VSILYWSPPDQFHPAQYQLSTFRAEMALGSWITSPLYPGFDKVTQIIEKKMDDDFFSS